MLARPVVDGADWPRRLTLRRGRSVEVRPIEPRDRGALAEMHGRLSDESLYRRYLAPHPRLSDAELTHLTEIDHREHEALVALDGDEMVGVVRYLRIDEHEAEPAMLIRDDYQGLGLCSAMLDLLAACAWAAGIHRFHAIVFASNEPALHALERLGRSVRHRLGTEIDLEIDLRAPDLPAPVHRDRRARRLSSTRRALADDLAPRKEEVADAELRDVIVAGVAVDGLTTPTVVTAAELARELGCELRLVAARRREAAGEVTAALERTAALLSARGVTVATTVRRTTPAAAMVAVAAEERARLVVVGAPHRSAGGLVRASTIADAVARQASCDVLVVRS